MKPIRMLMVGAIGAGIAYLFDPVSGKRRRAETGDRLARLARQARRGAESRATMMKDRATGLGSEAASRATVKREYDDATLADKVRTELLADPALKGRVNVSVEKGTVLLVGEVDEPESVAERAKKIEGVTQVENLLHRPGTPARHSA